MSFKKLQIILVILISIGIGYQLGHYKVSFDWKNYKPQIEIVNAEPPADTSSVDFTRFWTVWQKVQDSYYDKTKVDPQKMLDGAIMGMVDSLGDPYTLYLPPQRNTDFKQDLAGQFEGIGAELGLSEKQIIVVSPLDGSPAQKAGIKAQDAIVKVDGASTAGWSLSQAVSKIRGEKGTRVTLTVIHKDEQEPKDIVITRDVITVKSVDGWIKKISEVPNIKLQGTLSANKDAQVAYIRLSQFGDSTNKDWLSLVNSFYSQIQGNSNVKGIILDVRNNPGGYLTDAVFVASEFLEQGKPVVVQEDGKGDKTILSVNRKGLFTDTPVVVLINKGSASASEIVSGALRDNKRALLVGDTSFGKGTIQQAEELGGDAGLHVTIAKWLTPNDVWVHGVGLTPDIKVSLSNDEPERDSQLEKAIEELLK